MVVLPYIYHYKVDLLIQMELHSNDRIQIY